MLDILEKVDIIFLHLKSNSHIIPALMRNIIILTSFIALLFAVAGCNKERVKIGQGDPEAEMQKCVKLSEKKKFEEAIECLEVYKSRYPNSEHGQGAELRIGDAYFRKKEYLLAADSYQTFIKLHPGHPQVDYAFYRLGLSYLYESPKAIDRDQEYMSDAIKYLQAVVSNFPSSPYHELATKDLNDAKLRVAKRHFYIGNFYYRTGEYIAAIPRFMEIVNNYPDCGLMPESLYRITVACIKLRNIDAAKEAYNILLTKFPSNEFTKKAESKLLNASSKGV